MEQTTRDTIPVGIQGAEDRERWVNAQSPQADPDWDPNEPQGLANIRRYQRLFTDSIRAAAKRPMNYTKVREIRQKKRESPDAFYERLIRAYKTFTNLDVEAEASRPTIIMAFVTQCARDIRRKILKIEGFEGHQMSYLLQVARNVYDRRMEEEEEESDEDSDEDGDQKKKKKKEKRKEKVKSLVAVQAGDHKVSGAMGTQSEELQSTSPGEKVLQLMQLGLDQLRAQSSPLPAQPAPAPQSVPAPPPPPTYQPQPPAPVPAPMPASMPSAQYQQTPVQYQQTPAAPVQYQPVPQAPIQAFVPTPNQPSVFNAMVNTLPQPQYSQVNAPNPRASDVCHRCFAYGHWAAQCPFPDQNRGRGGRRGRGRGWNQQFQQTQNAPSPPQPSYAQAQPQQMQHQQFPQQQIQQQQQQIPQLNYGAQQQQQQVPPQQIQQQQIQQTYGAQPQMQAQAPLQPQQQVYSVQVPAQPQPVYNQQQQQQPVSTMQTQQPVYVAAQTQQPAYTAPPVQAQVPVSQQTQAYPTGQTQQIMTAC